MTIILSYTKHGYSIGIKETNINYAERNGTERAMFNWIRKPFTGDDFDAAKRGDVEKTVNIDTDASVNSK